jgi:hypothetical protein
VHEESCERRKMSVEIKKVGRPKKKEEEKVKYQRIAISSFAYDIFKSISEKDGITLVNVLDDLAKEQIKKSNQF